MIEPSERERAARLRAMRAYTGRSQREVAAILNVSTTTLSRMENARGSAPSMDQLRDLARVHDEVPMDFAELGFEPMRRPMTEVERRLYRLEEALEELVRPSSPAEVLEQAADQADERQQRNGEESERTRRSASGS